MKTCTGCKESKSLTEFYKRSGADEKYFSKCKVCVKTQRNAKYRTDPEFRARQINDSRARYRNDPDYNKRTKDNAKQRNVEKRREDPHGRYRYRKAHEIVVAAKGSASTHQCNSCDKSALDWALIHGSSGIQKSINYEWSDDPNDYMPLCRSCHKIYDVGV